MKKFLILFFPFICLVCLLTRENVFSQSIVEKKLNGQPYWWPGSILLEDDIMREGMISFNELANTVAFGTETDTTIYTAESVVNFKIGDRKFYSFEFATDDGKTKAVLCEILKVYEDFIVFSRKDPLKLVAATGKRLTLNADPGGVPFHYANQQTISEQSETIYFSDGPENIDPYLKISQTDTDGGFLGDSSKKRNKIFDENLIARYTGDYWQELLRYSKQNKLALDKKDGLLRVLDYYDQLLGR